MFYLYIDEVLISSYHNFNEVQNFIFDFFGDHVEFPRPFNVDDLVELSDCIIESLHGLIRHQYAHFTFYDREVQIYYGY